MSNRFGLAVRLLVLVSVLAIALSAQTPAPGTEDVERRVESLLKQMTLEEKIDLLSGTGFSARSLPRLNLPEVQMTDGSYGVRGSPSTIVGGIALAATWDTSLAFQIGGEVGRDGRARGTMLQLAPAVNIYRAPMNGRNFEYFGEDPFLAGQIASGYIRGLQSYGVSATIKHFAANNSEFSRNTVDSVIDERTLREIYLPAFEAAVKQAHVGAVMNSYNLVNGEHATENHHLNIDILKNEWGFKNVLMSDWGATHNTLAAANGGMDLEMPFGTYFNRKTLLPLIEEGRVREETINDKVRRLLRTAIGFGWLDRKQLDDSIPLLNQQGRAAALRVARESIVLLKNDSSLLPIDRTRIKSVAVIGPDAYRLCPSAAAVPRGGHSSR